MAGEITAAILTVSDSGAHGDRDDTSGPELARCLKSLFGISSPERFVVPDERTEISARIARWCEEGIALVLVTGGTGVSPRDRTPEAVRSIIDFEIPGFAEKMRAETGKHFPAAFLSRQVAGVRQRTLILALPGSPRGAVECLEVVASLIPHAVGLIRGEAVNHPSPRLPPG